MNCALNVPIKEHRYSFLVTSLKIALSSTLNAFDTDTDNINRELEKKIFG